MGKTVFLVVYSHKIFCSIILVVRQITDRGFLQCLEPERKKNTVLSQYLQLSSLLEHPFNTKPSYLTKPLHLLSPPASTEPIDLPEVVSQCPLRFFQSMHQFLDMSNFSGICSGPLSPYSLNNHSCQPLPGFCILSAACPFCHSLPQTGTECVCL